MDTFTRQHLEAWIESNIYYLYEQEEFEKYAKQALLDDPLLAEYGWRSLYNVWLES